MNITDLPHTVVADADLTDKVESPEIGQLVVIYSRGRNRVARVVKVGPKRITAEYTTPSAVEQAWKLAAMSHEAQLVARAKHDRQLAARYEATAELIERLGVERFTFDEFVPLASLPAEWVKATADNRNRGVDRGIAHSPEQLRKWAADSREGADRAEAKLPEARAHDARPLADKAADYVQMTTKNVSRDAVWAAPAS
jgi:hypothetical protein